MVLLSSPIQICNKSVHWAHSDIQTNKHGLLLYIYRDPLRWAGTWLLLQSWFREFFDLTKHMAKGHCLKYVHEYKCKICGTEYGISSSYCYSFYYLILSSHYSFIVCLSRDLFLFHIKFFLWDGKVLDIALNVFIHSPPTPSQHFYKEKDWEFWIGYRFFLLFLSGICAC